VKKISFKKLITVIVAVILVVVVICGVLAPSCSCERTDLKERYTVLSAENWDKVPTGENCIKVENVSLNGQITSSKFVFKKSDIIEFNTNGIEGIKKIGLTYSFENAKSVDNIFNLSVADTEYQVVLPAIWRDKEGKYQTDRFGNEIAKEQLVITDTVFSPLFDKRNINHNELEIDLTNAETVKIENKTQNVNIESIWIYRDEPTASYSDYIKNIKGSAVRDTITIEGENYSAKSDSIVRASCVNIAGMHPYNTYNRLINNLNGSSWSSAGQKIIWEFEVENDGIYNLSFRFCQNSSTNKKIYRDIEIDGFVPFKEFENVSFEQTSSQKYSETTIKDENNNPYSIYLSKGKHTISMNATMAPAVDLYNKLNDIISRMNELGTSITKLTAGVSDKNRTWDLDVYLPGAIDKMNGFIDEINGVYDEFCELEGEKATYADDLLYAVDMLENLLSSPRTIPNRMEKFSSGDSSAIKYISTVISNISYIPLDIDEIYFVGTNTSLNVKKVSFFSKLVNSIMKFAYSMTPEAVAETNSKIDEKSLNVWMSRSSVYVQALQTMVDSEKQFEGKKINISIMPSEQKLILAAAAGTSPDVVLGCAYTTPYKFAIRGAAKNLLDYDDFLTFYTSQYNIEALVPCAYDGGVYGAVETQDYNILFYRKDILSSLGISVPDTWDDVKSVMPTLLRYNKNFSLPISNVVGYKSFTLTSPYIFQNNGEYYSKNGGSSSFLSQNTMTGFSELTDLFKIYAVDEYVASFYNSFRSGNCPLGLGGVSTYVQLTEAAPELSGLWDIAPAPGIKDENGKVVRYNCADTTATMIFKSTKNPELSWEFLKWWLADDTQVSFANTMERSYGREYKWNTANLNAFEESTYSEEHKEIIKIMWDSQKEIVQHPAGYIVEREISNAFTNVVVNGKSIIDSLEDATLVSNREIIRKLQEFKYCDENGNLIKDYPISVLNDLKKKAGGN